MGFYKVKKIFMLKIFLIVTLVIFITHLILIFVGTGLIISRSEGSIWINFANLPLLFLKTFGISLTISILLTLLYVGWNYQKGLIVDEIKKVFYLSFAVAYLLVSAFFVYEYYKGVRHSIKMLRELNENKKAE